MSWDAGISMYFSILADPDEALALLFRAKAHQTLDAGATACCSFRTITGADLSTTLDIAASPLLKTRIFFSRTSGAARCVSSELATVPS
jgi:hypothetical protein